MAQQRLRELRQKREGSKESAPLTLPESHGVDVLAIAIRYLPGGKQRFIEFVRLAAMNGDPSAAAFWNVYADLPDRQRKKVNLGSLCEACGVKPSQILSSAVGHGVEAATDVGNLVAAALHPEVIAAAGKSALRIDGDFAAIAAEDRKQLLQARGFLPVPKGASIHLHANASANAQAAAAVAQDPSVPKFAQDMETLRIPKTTVQRQLAEASPDSVIDVVPVPAAVER